MLYATRPIAPEDPSSGFRCGEHALDDYFRRHAFHNHETGIACAYVLPAAQGGVIGYYTLSMASVEPSTVAPLLAIALPRYPTPVALLGRFAIHERCQRQGFGETLLLDAFNRVLNSTVGCTGVMLDAKTERAASFYAHYGFLRVQAEGGPQRRMFIPLGSLRAARE